MAVRSDTALENRTMMLNNQADRKAETKGTMCYASVETAGILSRRHAGHNPEAHRNLLPSRATWAGCGCEEQQPCKVMQVSHAGSGTRRVMMPKVEAQVDAQLS